MSTDSTVVPPPGRNTITKAVTFDPPLLARAQTVAKQLDAPFSLVTRWALREWLDKHHPTAKA